MNRILIEYIIIEERYDRVRVGMCRETVVKGKAFVIFF